MNQRFFLFLILALGDFSPITFIFTSRMNHRSFLVHHLHAKDNLLPEDGEVYYYGPVFEKKEADEYLTELRNEVQLEHDVVVMFGKTIITKRKSAWYADSPQSYTYSGIKRTALPWTENLFLLKQFCEQLTKESYNSCLLNYYHNGSESMSWHCDDEKDLKPNGSIASLSFGAARRFDFRHKKTKETVQIMLEHGSLLEMKGLAQTFWHHRLPSSAKVSAPRLNLTFRTVV
ncbi:MAG TPA: alpha-ketoglutarate-dependent dioxygenase AlkB [Niabella sp.]|nr:alpha-ketoglutarate-dependent dioxygenase AlkB [Niabella sp.]HQW14931.1 alpha-ketoglutarate-dependent dioxygenase AlkB [Niabella sp.]HQX20177.1 alpha-ketoglutarate-dependent dioxygenase AlkB [Niabella sp.]HQX42693.1 alpha-ketoglutarate-dependent dioxygenase AlkB [Niabella sp.]HRB06782.1 alpha-ketoglutarate-dependent dioxygenase AlkB [Niabella sp.]